MLDRGFFLTLHAIRRQLAAMPNDFYLVRLIHHATGRAFPGERLWTADQLASGPTVRFIRVRNREGCDIYIHPYAAPRNAGYILLDLDAASPTVVDALRRDGLEPCVILQTSPGHLQAWLRLSPGPLQPALATALAKQLARAYGADLASADWRPLGRLAGFTNQKPARRRPGGYSPWVTLLHAHPGIASRGEAWIQSVTTSLTGARPAPIGQQCFQDPDDVVAPPITQSEAIQIYQHWIRRWRIPERFPRPDWSIVDLWVARQLLSQGVLPARV